MRYLLCLFLVCCIFCSYQGTTTWEEVEGIPSEPALGKRDSAEYNIGLQYNTWYVNTNIEIDSVGSQEYMKKFFAWEKHIYEYDPNENFIYDNALVEVSGLGKCYICTFKFTQWHPMCQKKVCIVAVPNLEKVLIFHYHDIEFNQKGLVLTYNFRGNFTKYYIHYDTRKQLFIIDNIQFFPRQDDDD